MNFIKKLKIKNFFSIKNEIEIDFLADNYTIENYPERLFKLDGSHFNKIKAIYGANTSGKTSILKALVFVSFILSNKSSHFPIHYSNIYSDEENSFIELEFVLNNQTFNYRVDFNIKNNVIDSIKNEILETNKLTLLNRENKIFRDLKNNKIGDSILFDKISPKKSIISEAITRTNDYDNFIKFFDGIVSLSNILGSYDVALQLRPEENVFLANLFSKENIKIFEDRFENIDKKEFYIFFKRMIRQLGLDIKDVEASVKEKNNLIDVEFKIFHSIDKSRALPFQLESHGTQNIFKLIFSFYYAYKNKTILVIDELDTILHPMIVPIFILFAIENDIQLIYSTHNIYNLKYLYKDEILIVEKDRNHLTMLKSPKNKKEIKGYENLLRLYEENILGGLPNITYLELKMENLIKS